MYPPGTDYLHSYFESRGTAGPCDTMDWVCFFGLQPLLMKHLEGAVLTEEDIRNAEEFCTNHFGRSGLFNRVGWSHILHEHGGRLPISIRAVPEGTVVNNRNVMMTIENTCKQSAWLVNFLETLLVQVWYPTTVATMSREIKKLIAKYMLRSGGNVEGLDFKLHDFGFRGVSSLESAGLGGAAHLVNFNGTDTVHGIRYAQEYYGADMAGFSIPATEHSIMTARGEDGEDLVLDQVLDEFPEGLVATVGDSYDMFEYIETILAARKEKILARNGTLVVRPDSGDPVIMVIEVLDRLEKVFGSTLNEQGFKVLPPQVRAIQGDGISYVEVRQILEMMMLRRWSAENIAFGMGGALLQKLNRDTLKFAFKLSEITIDGEPHPVCKNPKTDQGKASKAGRMKLVQVFGPDGMSYQTVSPEEAGEDQLVEVFRNGEILQKYSFDEVRKRASDSYGV